MTAETLVFIGSVVIITLVLLIYRALYNRKIEKTLQNTTEKKNIWPTPKVVVITTLLFIFIGISLFERYLIELDEKNDNTCSIHYLDMSDEERAMFFVTTQYHATWYVVGEELDFSKVTDDKIISGMVKPTLVDSSELSSIQADKNGYAIIFFNNINGKIEMTKEQWKEFKEFADPNPYICWYYAGYNQEGIADCTYDSEDMEVMSSVEKIYYEEQIFDLSNFEADHKKESYYENLSQVVSDQFNMADDSYSKQEDVGFMKQILFSMCESANDFQEFWCAK